ncbi:hypothetical protein CCUS01_14701 [Colletotrichum cuscutae]|uniref:Uncharacterized protein n=1 Tax=Colletotrichum cuscutae TaxID=1209917 RepID=A0AAI9VGY9_9PEZI|nr:hypothetical protein CCUS01_14701 [Colletotrichum cuscutae]
MGGQVYRLTTAKSMAASHNVFATRTVVLVKVDIWGPGPIRTPGSSSEALRNDDWLMTHFTYGLEPVKQSCQRTLRLEVGIPSMGRGSGSRSAPCAVAFDIDYRLESRYGSFRPPDSLYIKGRNQRMTCIRRQAEMRHLRDCCHQGFAARFGIPTPIVNMQERRIHLQRRPSRSLKKQLPMGMVTDATSIQRSPLRSRSLRPMAMNTMANTKRSCQDWSLKGSPEDDELGMRLPLQASWAEIRNSRPQEMMLSWGPFPSKPPRIREYARAIIRRWLARVKPFPAHYTGLIVAWGITWPALRNRQTGPNQPLGVSTPFLRLIPDRDLNSKASPNDISDKPIISHDIDSKRSTALGPSFSYSSESSTTFGIRLNTEGSFFVVLGGGLSNGTEPSGTTRKRRIETRERDSSARLKEKFLQNWRRVVPAPFGVTRKTLLDFRLRPPHKHLASSQQATATLAHPAPPQQINYGRDLSVLLGDLHHAFAHFPRQFPPRLRDLAGPLHLGREFRGTYLPCLYRFQGEEGADWLTYNDSVPAPSSFHRYASQFLPFLQGTLPTRYLPFTNRPKPKAVSLFCESTYLAFLPSNFPEPFLTKTVNRKRERDDLVPEPCSYQPLEQLIHVPSA